MYEEKFVHNISEDCWSKQLINHLKPTNCHKL